MDEEAFKEVVSPPIYTSTIKAQIAPSPPHPLELQQHGAAPKPILVSHLATVDVPNGRQQAAPIATLDSDYEDEQLILEQESAEIEEAVIKIQAGVRGYLVRKHHANQSAKLPIKSISLDESVLLKQQQQQSPENILPPPESFESIVAISAVSNSSKPLSIQSKHRVETPIPGSPPFAQDDTNYRILDTDVDILQETVQSVQSTTVVPLIANPEELEIFKKINEINQLLASKDDDDEAIAVIPEPPKQQPQPPVANLHQSTAATTMNSAVSSSSINKALSELDQTIHEQEMSLPPEEEDVVDAKKDDEVIVLESAFSDVPLSEPSSTVPPGPMSPSVLVKAPSLDEEEVPEEESLLGESLLSETAAAIRIQAAFRGYEVRKSLSREVSPARSTEEEKVVVVEEMAEVKVAEPKEEPAQFQPAAAPTEPVPAAAATETEESKGGEAAKPTAEDFAEVLSLIPQPVNEELIPVMELSDQDIIEDYVEEKQPEGEEKLADNAQIITSGGEEQQPKQQQPATDADVNVAVKEGFGTLASSAKAAEAVVVVATAEEKKEEKATAAAQVPVPDIEKSIKELEKSFDRDLLADVASEATAAVAAAVATAAAAAATAPSPATPATPIIIEANSVSNSSQQLSITGEEKESLISIEPPTPEISTSQQQQAPAFSTEQQTPAPAPEQLPSKIPILDRANKSILKEPSSPEPHTYSTNLSPLLLSSPADGSGGNDENSDEESCSTPSPIPLRSSSPSPFSKKRPRRHRKKK